MLLRTISISDEHLLKVEYVAQRFLEDVVGSDGLSSGLLVYGFRALKVEHANLPLPTKGAIYPLNRFRGSFALQVKERFGLPEGCYG